MGLFDFIRRVFLGDSRTSTTPTPVRPPPIPSQQPPEPARPATRFAAAESSRSRAKVQKLNLDAGQFAPISHSQAKILAKNLRFNWAFFGRRDIIPPADDPRTKLIDGAMVGLGLLTPEQLVEMHEAGEKMAELRPALHEASIMAQRAVERDKEEKRALKEEKRAAAQRRREEWKTAVACRKATDIIFLGRGVSGGLSDRRTNVERLQFQNLPVLATPADLARALGITISRLRWLAYHSEASSISHYVRFEIPKKSGGSRQLAAPHQDLRKCQEWILMNILQHVRVHESAHGFVRGRSTMSNAVPHVRREVLVNADLKDFFPSITFPRVKGIFQQLGYSPAVSTVLALLCTESPRAIVNYAGKTIYVATGPRALPQGACTSPALSNLAARCMDSRLSAIARRLGWNYTRYADDLSFSTSGDAVKFTGYLLARVRHISEDESFIVNEAKTRVQRRNTAQSVTGIVVNQRPNVPRKIVRQLRAILYRAKTEGLAAQNRENHPNFTAWVDGMISYISMVNPDRGSELRQAFREVSAQ